MDLAISLINALACGLISIVLVGAVLSPAVKDGIIIKAGLGGMALGFFSLAMCLFDGLDRADGVRLVRAMVMVNFGIAVCIVGYLVRTWREQHPLRRGTDWVDLDE